jgi:hypothetical protein
MPNLTFRRWTAGEIAKLKNLGSEASKPFGDRGESPRAKAVTRMRYQSDQVQRSRGLPVWIERL